MNQDQWGRETAPPMRPRPGRRVDPATGEVIEPPYDPDPFGLRWMVDAMTRSALQSLIARGDLGPCPEVPWIPDPSFSPMQIAWLAMEIEHRCAKRGRPIQLIRADLPPPPPTPGELLAASMTLLPALPPTAGGLCPPQKA